MAASALVDAGFLVALLSRRDDSHRWAAEQASRFPPPWMTCEAVLSETFHLLGGRGIGSIALLLRRGILISGYRFADDPDAVLKLLEKYSQVPMSFAGADELRRCLSCTDDRSRERSHVVDHGFRLPYLSAARPADDSLRAPALKPAQCLERVRRRRRRVHRRERWRARCAPSQVAKTEAVTTGRGFFCESNPILLPRTKPAASDLELVV